MLQSVWGSNLNYSGSLIAPELLSFPGSQSKEHGAGVLFSLKKKKKVFIWPHWVLVASLGILCHSARTPVVRQAQYLQRAGLVAPQHVGS